MLTTSTSQLVVVPNAWVVVPMRPKGTEGWDEEQLASILTRDTLVGVALPRV